MSDIRVTYTGLISLAVGILSVLTGIAFTLIVTRQLTVEEFGTWSLIGGLLAYVLISEPVISYWVTREIARGEETGKTAIFASAIFSSGSILAYLVVAYFVAIQSNLDPSLLFLASPLAVIMFFERTLAGINYGWKPHVVSYGLLAIETGKIPTGLMFVYILDLGLMGAIITTIIAYLISVFIHFWYAREKIRGKIFIDVIKKWTKLSWITLYPGLANFIFKSDIVLFPILTGGITGLAYYAAANTVASLVMQSGAISRAIYPKLLSGDNRQYLKENLTRMFFFAIPFTTISIMFMESALFALNPEYKIAIFIGLVLTGRMFLVNLASIFQQALTAIEKVDDSEKSTFRDYIRSKLVFLPTLNVVQGGVYMAIFIVMMVMLKDTYSQLELTLFWSILIFIVEIPFTVYLLGIVKKQFKNIFDFYPIAKYVISTLISFIPVYFIMENTLVFDERIFVFLPNLFAYVIIGIGLYIITTYLIDNKTRNLVKNIFSEIVKK